VVAGCQPNAAHYALAAAEERARERGVDFHVVTQNIDRLHQAAGSSNVVEMHGSLW
jgi:NAD-dependent SIR2 family protein deacetylase